MQIPPFEGWLKDNLVCPRDHKELRYFNNLLLCPDGHTYPVVEGIPVMLLKDKKPTQYEIYEKTWSLIDSKDYSSDNLYNRDLFIDPFVQQVISATCGKMYKSLINKLSFYPIPRFPLDEGKGRYLLDIGCNWGRWCISAARSGYIPIGIDPNLEAIMAAVRVSKHFNLNIDYIVADARYLPFRRGSFDVVFSYSVFQHFDKNDFIISLSEISEVLKKGGISFIQMPNIFGIHNLYHYLRNYFKKSLCFDVSYYSPLILIDIFEKKIGPTSLSVDGFFSLNPDDACMQVLPLLYRFLLSCSSRLRNISRKIKFLTYIADSLYISSVKT